MPRYEYAFEPLELSAGGYSLFGGVGIRMEGHRAIIDRRGAEGWRYAGWLPVRQRATGHVEEVELVFCRETPEQQEGNGL